MPGNNQFSVAQFFFNQQARHHGNAATGLRRPHAHIESIESWTVIATVRMKILMKEPVMPCFRPRSALNQNHIGQTGKFADDILRHKIRVTHRPHPGFYPFPALCPGQWTAPLDKGDLNIGLIMIEWLELALYLDMDTGI